MAKRSGFRIKLKANGLFADKRCMGVKASIVFRGNLFLAPSPFRVLARAET